MASTGRCSLLFKLYLILRLSLVVSVHNDLREGKFYKLEGKSLFGNLTERHLTQNALDCSFLCVNSVKKNCFSFNFGGMEQHGLYECELSSSEIKLNPENLHDKQGFAYYGMKEESLYSYLPCASSPCKQGKECIESPFRGLYSCECPLENIGMTFTDDNCSVDMQQIAKGKYMVNGVQVAVFKGHKLNFFEAEKLCKLLDATMASYDQLYAAWESGLEECRIGWISSARGAYPMQNPVASCGNLNGIFITDVKDKFNSRQDVWCYYN